MDDSHARKFQKDLNGALVALVLLAVLEQSSEDPYGYEIASGCKGRTKARPYSKRERSTRSCARSAPTGS